jgi:hypothetical protein
MGGARVILFHHGFSRVEDGRCLWCVFGMESPAHGRLPAGLASAIFAGQDAPAERRPGGTREAEGGRLREQFPPRRVLHHTVAEQTMPHRWLRPRG